ncbi:MAG: DUF4375 domain-containing protein [Gemmatimonadaceae bacterium]|nr:DUF4375 domain-containing protein [Gemmatimonadaceae bacterium]
MLLATTTFFIREVDNGGLAPAFHNQTLDELEAVIGAFEELGAARDAQLVRGALTDLFDGGWPKAQESLDARVDALNQAWIGSHFASVDEQLYYETRLWPALPAVYRRAPAEFFLPDDAD